MIVTKFNSKKYFKKVNFKTNPILKPNIEF